MGDDAASRRDLLTRGAALVPLAVLPSLASAVPPVPPVGETLDVRLLGARGDGTTDDAAAFQAALDALPDWGGALRVPAGRYRIARPLALPSMGRLAILGEGFASRLQMEADEPLLRASESATIDKFLMTDLAVESIGAAKSPGTPAVALDGGMTGSTFSNVWFDGQKVPLGGAVRVKGVSDTSAFVNCVSWGTSGVAFEIGRGAEVRFMGGRIIGDVTQRAGGVGILLAGGNGGVHVLTTDVIGHHTGLQIGGVGGPANREIFLTQATFDSSVYGIRQYDAAFVSVAGIWAASSDEAQISIEETARGALFVCAGGTIFNGGAYGRKGSKNGLVAMAGAFNLSGVDVRHNQGVGITVGPGAQDWMVTGCRIHHNGTATRISGNRRKMMANNLMFDNGHWPQK